MGVSADTSGAPDLATMILGGNQSLAVRINELNEAKASHDASLAALQLGQVTAENLEAAKAKNAEAEKYLEAAKQQADELLQAAKTEAYKIVEDANQAAEDLQEASKKEKAIADAELAAARSSAKKLTDAAAAKAAEADQKQAKADADIEAAKVAQENADGAAKRASDMRDDVMRRVGILEAALLEVKD